MRLRFFVTLYLFLSFTACAQIPNYLPADSLIGYWPFNGNANDVSGNGNDGIINAAILTMDRDENPNSSYFFDGQTSYIDLINTDELANFSINFWCQPDTVLWYVVNGGNLISQKIVSKYCCSNSFPNGWEIYFDGDSLQGIGNGSIGQGNQPPLRVHNWYNISYTYNSFTKTFKSYLNGNAVGEIDSFEIISNGIKIRLGGRPSTPADFFFKGKIDDVGIWNRTLTSNEVIKIYESKGNVGINTTTPARNLHINNTLRLEPRNSPPDNPAKGDIYFDGVINKLRVYDGSQWQNCW